MTTRGLGLFLFLLAAAVATVAAQVTYVTNTTVTVVPVAALSATNAPARHVKPVRRWAKQCPHCHTICISTNLVWNGGHVEAPGTLVRDGMVTFECSGDKFTDQVHEAVETSPPMVELPPEPGP